MAAVMVLATDRADVNRTVRKHLGVRRISFADQTATESATGMTSGGITPVGLPADWPILVDERVAAAAVEEGVATLELDNPRETIANLMWTPEYPEVEVVDSIETPSARPTDPGAQGVRHTGDDSPLSRWRPRLPRLKG